MLCIQNGSYIGQALPKVTSHHLWHRHAPPAFNPMRLNRMQAYVSFNLNGQVPSDSDGHWQKRFGTWQGSEHRI